MPDRPAAPAGTVTTRSTVGSVVYGSVGCWSVGASVRTVIDALADGVEVTSVMKPPSVEPRPATTTRRPPRPTYRTAIPRTATAAMRPGRTTSGRPRVPLDRSVPGQARRPGSARLDLDGSGPAGGRGTGSDVGLPVVAPSRHRADCRTRCPRSGSRASRRPGPTGPRRTVRDGALYSGAVARVTSLRRVRPELREWECRLAIREVAAGRPARPADRSSVSVRSLESLHHRRAPARPAGPARGRCRRRCGPASGCPTSAATSARTST